MANINENSQNIFKVYFDGSCPLCSREIGWYQKRRGANDIDWVDISDKSQFSNESDLTVDRAMQRFHIRKRDGSLMHGAVAFAELWRNLPSLKLVGAFVSLPIIRHLAEVLYRVMLKIRPFVQRTCN